MFWNRKSHQILPTAESENELTQGPVSEVVSPKGRERVRKRVLFLLLVSFLLIFIAVDILFDFHRTQEDMFRELETNLDITEDEVKEIVFVLIIFGISDLFFIGVFSFAGFFALIVTGKKCRNQVWSNIFRLRWPQAWSFVAWAGITICLYTSALVFVISLLCWRFPISFITKNYLHVDYTSV